MSKHTGGPWNVTGEDVRDNDIFYRIEAEGYGLVALVDATPDCDEMRANASLIAAAPALLAACKRLLSEDFLHGGVGRRTAIRGEAKVALALAEKGE